MPEDRAARQYFYYAVDGSERELATEYRSGKGLIWQERPGTRGGKTRMFIFFVGTEEQSNTQSVPGFPVPSCQYCSNAVVARISSFLLNLARRSNLNQLGR
jgi:hypothetical protein